MLILAYLEHNDSILINSYNPILIKFDTTTNAFDKIQKLVQNIASYKKIRYDEVIKIGLAGNYKNIFILSAKANGEDMVQLNNKLAVNNISLCYWKIHNAVTKITENKHITLLDGYYHYDVVYEKKSHILISNILNKSHELNNHVFYKILLFILCVGIIYGIPYVL